MSATTDRVEGRKLFATRGAAAASESSQGGWTPDRPSLDRASHGERASFEHLPRSSLRKVGAPEPGGSPRASGQMARSEEKYWTEDGFAYKYQARSMACSKTTDTPSSICALLASTEVISTAKLTMWATSTAGRGSLVTRRSGGRYPDSLLQEPIRRRSVPE